ncbi:MAG TPA: Clp protease N-terminal domain-containing protein, partial [Candidatus Hydrogenedentes bacterium]|nr:Clp protease N-terminal domain-containing protein [Candidatus Hydrogenedentota bacterium]
MRLDKLTIRTQEALAAAVDLAARQQHPEVTALHVLAALLEQDQGAVVSILQRLGVAPGQLAGETRQALERLPRVSGAAANPGLSGEAQQALEAGWRVAQSLKDEYLSTEHVLIGIIEHGRGDAAQLLKRHGVTKDDVLRALRDVRGTQRVTDPNAETTYDALEKYS